MFNVVLYQPEIPPNTGNIMRLCANTGCKLHLIEPLGFSIADKDMKRANLDYEMMSPPILHASFQDFLVNEKLDSKNANAAKIYLCSTKAKTIYSELKYEPGAYFVFGPETRGLPAEILAASPDNQKIIIPMQATARSLNLANSVAVIVYEAWRQQGFGKAIHPLSL